MGEMVERIEYGYGREDEKEWKREWKIEEIEGWNTDRKGKGNRKILLFVKFCW